jgi:outer membrane lipoprotein SlyB
MSEGLLELGLSGKKSGEKGLIDAAKLESEIDMQNLSLQTQSDVQHKQMGAETAMAGGVAGGWAGATYGAALGTAMFPGAGTVVGAVAGAALGFLVSKLF